MFTSNLIPIVIEPILINEELTTNIKEVIKSIEMYGAENISCVFSTTSCFSPRGYDNIKELSILCKKNQIYHVVNNAYGIYCTKIIDILNQSVKVGTIDVLISSTDKNFMVPVGGSLVYSANENIITQIKKNYPGRASLSPILDLFITLLDIGKTKYKLLVIERKEKFKKLKEMMSGIASKYKEKIIETPNNKISLAMSLTTICQNAKDKNEITYLGSLFYFRQISGIRIIAPSAEIDFNGFKFTNYGSHCNEYPVIPYCSFACAIGITDQEIESFGSKFCVIVDSYMASLIQIKKINSICDTEINTNFNKTNKDKEKNKQKGKGKDIQKIFNQKELSIEKLENININI